MVEGPRTGFLRSIVHVEFRAHATDQDVRRLCLEARHYRFGAVLVHPIHCARAAEALRATDVRLVAAVAFPTGAFTTAGKVFEVRDAISHGADEIAFVVDVGALRSGKEELIADEMCALREAVGGCPLTAMLETSVLTDEQTKWACNLAADTGIEYIAPFTGFGSGGAPTVEEVRRLATTVGERIGVVAWGRAGTLDEGRGLLGAGATRLCTEVGVCLVLQLREGAQ